MERDELRRIGRLSKPWGHRGELTVRLEGVLPEEIQPHGSLFVEIDGQMVPFIFTALFDKGRETLIKFEEIDDPQAASVLVGCDILIAPGLLSDGSDESWDPDELIGLLVRDEEHGDLGEVTGIDGTRDNPVMVIQSGTHEIMVPVVDEMIVSVDAGEGLITVRTPPGLVDLYRKGQ